MAFCISCGSRLEDGIKFCTTCGAKQELSEAVEEQAKVTNETPIAETEQVHTDAKIQEVAPEQSVEPISVEPIPRSPDIPVEPIPVQQIPPIQPGQQIPPAPPIQQAQQIPPIQPGQQIPPAPPIQQVQQIPPVQPGQQLPPPIPVQARMQQPYPTQPMMQQVPPPMYGGQPYHAVAVPPMEEAPMRGSKYAVAGTFSYFGLLFLFCIPFIGFISCLVMSFAMKNENIKRFSRAVLIWYIVGLVIAIAFTILFFMIGRSFSEMFQNYYEGFFDSMNGNIYY